MKKIILVLIVAISLLSLTSCEDYANKADNEQQQIQNINHDQVGTPDQEDDTDLDTAG